MYGFFSGFTFPRGEEGTLESDLGDGAIVSSQRKKEQISCLVPSCCEIVGYGADMMCGEEGSEAE